MSLPRKHNLEQLKRVRKLTKGDIGDIVSSKSKNKEDKMPNAYWMDNPLDRNVDTYESFIQKDNKKKNESIEFEDDAEIIWQNYLARNEDFINKNYMNIELIIDDIIDKNKNKDGIEYMDNEFRFIIQNYLDLETVTESFYNKGKGPGNDDFYVNRFKQTISSFNSPSILQTGKQVKVGNLNGYIDYVDDKNVYITTLKGDREKISFKKFLKEVEKEGIIHEKSGFPSEFWTKINENQLENYYYEDDEDEDFSVLYGTEDDPKGLRHKKNENIYVNKSKKVKCIDCGELINDTYQSKVNHIYNKHFNKPEMDGGVPQRKYTHDTTWPQGGKHIFKLMRKYFPEK